LEVAPSPAEVKECASVLDRVALTLQEVHRSNEFDYDNLFLATANGHPRDKRILFNEARHVYFVQWDLDRDEYRSGSTVSVSGFVHKFFHHFDPDAIIDKMKGGRNWANSKYHGMAAVEIKAQWDANGKRARDRGTVRHADIEKYINTNMMSEEKRQDKELQQWFAFERDVITANGLVPFRTEWRMFSDSSLLLTGTLDAIYTIPVQDDPENLQVWLIDHKFSKEIKKRNSWQKGFGPCEHLDDCNKNHYGLALNSYKYMLETYYKDMPYDGHVYKNIKVVHMVLDVFHETRDVYECVDIPDMSETLSNMLEARRREVLEMQSEM
jgi:hypothetical protein